MVGYNWSSTNSSIAAVSSYGLVSGLAPGSVTIATYVDYDMSINHCPLRTAYPSGTATVVCAVPTNFRIESVQQINTGELFFTYNWDSSSGNKADLAACTVGETVFYPNYPATTYTWPPPMVTTTPNPDIQYGPGSGQMFDHNRPPSSFQQPYAAAQFPATQRLWWNCPCYQNNATQYFAPDITITRSVSLVNGVWTYTITKSGYTNTKALP